MPDRKRVPIVLIAGLAAAAVRRLASALLDEHTAVLRHDLRELGQGVLLRTVRLGTTEQSQPVELAHGCLSCTLREDLLPLVRRLAAREDVHRIVLQLDPTIEPEPVCWALRNVLVDGEPLDDHVEVEAVLGVLDQRSWLDAATGDELLTEHGFGTIPGDDRTLAQLAVQTAELADAIVLTGEPADEWQHARTEAVLARLAPTAARQHLDDLDPAALLAGIGADARRGEPDGPHGPLLRGEPPLEPDSGVHVVLFSDSRPFHPQRLHQAIDVLLEDVVRTRGRAWVASQPERVLRLESAGGGLLVGDAGPWLATAPDWSRFPAERRALAAADWHDDFGDRRQELMVLTDGANPKRITEALNRALLTDAEVADGERVWAGYPDPFGGRHSDPCGAAEQPGETTSGNRREQQ